MRDKLFLGTAIATVLIYTHGMMWLYGTDHEARLALEAYAAAEQAYELAASYRYRLSTNLGVSERAVRVCLLELAE